MNPNSISHRLFAASLSQPNRAPARRPGRAAGKGNEKPNPAREAAANHATQKLSAWSWSGWQHTTI